MFAAADATIGVVATATAASAVAAAADGDDAVEGDDDLK